jgi:hypothetical protein
MGAMLARMAAANGLAAEAVVWTTEGGGEEGPWREVVGGVAVAGPEADADLCEVCPWAAEPVLV